MLIQAEKRRKYWQLGVISCPACVYMCVSVSIFFSCRAEERKPGNNCEVCTPGGSTPLRLKIRLRLLRVLIVPPFLGLWEALAQEPGVGPVQGQRHRRWPYTGPTLGSSTLLSWHCRALPGVMTGRDVNLMACLADNLGPAKWPALQTLNSPPELYQRPKAPLTNYLALITTGGFVRGFPAWMWIR